MRRSRETIQLNDLCFDRKYFHSATLRVDKAPGGFNCFLAITLFTHNGIREYCTLGREILDTVTMYNALLKQLGKPVLKKVETIRMALEKSQELEFHRSAQANREVAGQRSSPKADASAPQEPLSETSSHLS
jgi:hypothetical protein